MSETPNKLLSPIQYLEYLHQEEQNQQDTINPDFTDSDNEACFKYHEWHLMQIEGVKRHITALENAIREIESLIPGQGVEHHFGKAIQSAVDEVNKQGVEE